MGLPLSPKMLTKNFLPGLEVEHEVGLSGVGVCVVTATLACNTETTAAELIASPPNTKGLTMCGPVVHSLGIPPTLCIPQEKGTRTGSQVQYLYCTADNSAVYFWAKTDSGDGQNPVGVCTRLVCIR